MTATSLAVVALENDRGKVIAFAVERSNGELVEIVAPDTWETMADCEARARILAGLAASEVTAPKTFAPLTLAFCNNNPPRKSFKRAFLRLC